MAQAVIPLMIAGTVLSTVSTLKQGDAIDQAAKFEAKQLERNAKATFAEGTRAAAEHMRQGRIAESNSRAQMAGSGGVTDDPSAVQTLGESNANAQYNALAAMYSYKSAAQGQTTQAQARRLEGKNAKRASRLKALSTVISGGANTLAYKYG